MGARRCSRTISFLTLTALSATILAGGCCRSESWQRFELVDGGIQFELPKTWTVRVARPGQDPVDLAHPAPEGQPGAVVTALPLLEDAAMVIVAPQNGVKTDVFRRQAQLFIPLDDIVAADKPTPWGNGSFQGWASAGHGQLKGSGTTVDWRWVTLDIKGQSIIICLYAESAQAARYNETFNHILRSIAPLDSVPPA